MDCAKIEDDKIVDMFIYDTCPANLTQVEGVGIGWELVEGEWVAPAPVGQDE